MQQKLLNNRYGPRELLGSGGMAKVYLAHDEVLGRDVALKILRDQFAENEEFVERFKREARSAAALSHPNIVATYDRGCSESGDYYMVMEYVRGGTLKDLIVRGGPLDPDRAAVLAAQVAEALSVAHERGVVHRDIKPQNVLLTASGEAKVADFGIARAASATSISQTSLILGTASYMSPEQAMGKPATPRSDLYSLGVVLYEMLAGCVPFEAETPVAVSLKHVTETPPRPRKINPSVPEGLDAVVARLLSKNPDDRHQDAAELVEDLRRVREGLPPIVAVPPRVETPATPGIGDEETLLMKNPPVRPIGAGRGRSRRRGTVVRPLLASFAFLAVLGASGWSLYYQGAGDQSSTRNPVKALLGGAEIPGVEGLALEAAQEELEEAGFVAKVRLQESLEEDAGTVLAQSVPAGSVGDEGQQVLLEVGDGPDLVTVPDLAGMDAAEAGAALEEAGLILGARDRVPSEDVPVGEILEQSPRPGEALEPGEAVDLTISSGPEPPEEVAVPDVSGDTVEKATRLLEEAGLGVAGTRKEPGDEPAGTVVGTDPPAGSREEPGTEVTLLVSSGPPPAEPPEARTPEPMPAQPVPAAPVSPEPTPAEPVSPQPAASSAPADPYPASPVYEAPAPPPVEQYEPAPEPAAAPVERYEPTPALPPVEQYEPVPAPAQPPVEQYEPAPAPGPATSQASDPSETQTPEESVMPVVPSVSVQPLLEQSGVPGIDEDGPSQED